MNRWPLAPLLALVGGRSGLTARGIDTRQITRAEADGLSDLLADRYAVRCGFHAAEVWPGWMEAQIASVERECERHDCADRFLPRNSQHRFCSERCATTERVRRWRQDAAALAADRAHAARYYAENGDYVRARERRRYHERRSEAA